MLAPIYVGVKHLRKVCRAGAGESLVIGDFYEEGSNKTTIQIPSSSFCL